MFSALAQEGWDDEEVVIYLKKIRDEESNYLRDVTKAAAHAVSKGGEFKAMPHKRNSSGPVIEVSPPAFAYEQYKDGMNAKEVASAGLSLVSDAGCIFSFGEESEKVNDMNTRLNEDSAILDAWGEDEQVMVTMKSDVLLVDDDTGVEIVWSIHYENVFNAKSEFLAQKESLLEKAVVTEV